MFCLTDEAFKDFLLSRILKIRGSTESGVPAEDDRNTQVTLKIGAYTAVSDTQAKVITLDYGMCEGNAKVKFRVLLCYALRRLGHDDDRVARKQQNQQIGLLKREVVHEDHR